LETFSTFYFFFGFSAGFTGFFSAGFAGAGAGFLAMRITRFI